MPPRAQLPPHPSPFARLVWDAMQQRTAATGVPYTYVDLRRDMLERTGRNRSIGHLRNIVVGNKFPSEEMVEDIAATLTLDPDQAMLAAGFAPRAIQRITAAATSGEPGDSDRMEQLIADLDDLVDVARRAKDTYRRLLSGAPQPPAETDQSLLRDGS